MQHAGYLNSDNTITWRAKDIFINHRHRLSRGNTTFNFPCVDIDKTDIDKSKSPIISDVDNQDEFPTYYENWVYGIYATCLKILNVSSNIDPGKTGTFFDIFALSEKINRPSVIESVLESQNFEAYFKSCFPTNIPAANLMTIGTLNFVVVPDATPPVPPAIGQTVFETDVKKIVKPYTDFIPDGKSFVTDPPSKSFPNLVYKPPVLNLKDKQIALYTGLTNALKIFTKHLYENFNFIVNGFHKNFEVALNALYSLACEILGNNFPQYGLPPGEANDDKVAISDNINRNTLRRSLSKPLVISSFSLLFGTHEKGLSGKWKLVAPDVISVKQEEHPTEKKAIIELESDLAPMIGKNTRHSKARNTIIEAYKKYKNINPTLKQAQFCQAIAKLENDYGEAFYQPTPITGKTNAAGKQIYKNSNIIIPESKGANNWGNLHGSGPAGSFQAWDYRSDGTIYSVTFRKYATPEDGAAALLIQLFNKRPYVLKALEKSNHVWNAIFLMSALSKYGSNQQLAENWVPGKPSVKPASDAINPEGTEYYTASPSKYMENFKSAIQEINKEIVEVAAFDFDIPKNKNSLLGITMEEINGS